MAAIAALSNAAIINWAEGTLVGTAHAGPAASPYQSVGDMGAIDCGTLSADENRIFLPAPLITMMRFDLQNMVITNPLFLGIQTAAITELQNPLTNNSIQVLRNGYLFRRSPSIREAYVVGNTNPSWIDTLVWVDASGQTTSTRLVSDTGAPNTIAALEAASNAVVLQTWGGPTTVITPPTLFANMYPSALDSANILALDAAGGRTTIVVPAPVRSMFLADGITIDNANAAVITLYNAIGSELVTPGSGQSISQIVGGRLVRATQIGVR